MYYISDTHQLSRACDEVSELVQYLHTQQTTDTTTSLSKLPGCMSGILSNIILGMFKGLDTLGRVFAILYKGDNFVTCYYEYQIASEKGSILKGKNLLPLGANSFLLE